MDDDTVYPDVEKARPRDVDAMFATAKRFRKAQKLATLLADEGITYVMSEHMTDDTWSIATKACRMQSSSVVTRMLAMEIMRDREERMELLRSNGWKVDR